jgi:hypothetical protein
VCRMFPAIRGTDRSPDRSITREGIVITVSDLVYAMSCVVAGASIMVALFAAIAILRATWRGRHLTRRSDRAAVRARVGLTANGKEGRDQ